MKKNITLIKSLENYNHGCFDLLSNQIPNLSEYSKNNLDTKDSFYLKNHKRSIYKTVSSNIYLSIKGSLDNLEEYETKICSKESILGNNNINEMFPMLERKIPFQCLLTELTEEFELSIDFINKYLTLFNRVPNVPIPLSIFEYNREYQAEVINILKRNVSQFLSPHIDKIMTNDSFGVIEYLYPTPPFRLMDLKERDSRVQISWSEDFSIVFSWCDLFIDSLIIGYIPASKHSMIKGTALDPQNLLLSGGFSDMGSLIKLKEMNDTVLVESFYYCVKKIIIAAEILLESKNLNTSSLDERKTFINGKIQNYIINELDTKARELNVILPISLLELLNNTKEEIIERYFDMN